MRGLIRRWFMTCLMILGSLLFTLVFCEIILRVIGFSYPRFYEHNNLVGHKHAPLAAGWFRQEGEAYITINSQGWRDREHSQEKPENTVRIAVLGDSYAEALQVALEETFWAIMEQKLNACQAFGHKQVEVLNFGTAGYGTAQELIILQNYVWAYAPDIILLAFFTGNDIRNNSRALETEKLRPFFVFQENMLQLDDSFTSKLPVYEENASWLYSLRQISYQYLRIRQFFNFLKQRYYLGKIKREPLFPGEENGIDTMIYTEPSTPDWQEAWKVTEALLIRIRADVEQHRARLVVVTVSTSIQVHPDPAVRQHFMEEFGINDLFYPERRIKSFGERNQIEVLTLAPIFQKYVERTGEFLYGFSKTGFGIGHWNQNGHRLAGEIIAQYFCSQTL